MGGEIFIGLGTKCEQRFFWTNERYLTLTDEEHYALAQNGTVPAETQKWVITSKSGCLRQLNDFYPEIGQEYAGGHRLAVDSACDTGHDSEFWAIASPYYANLSLHDLDTPFTLVESHDNRTRRLAYYANTTTPYTPAETEGGGGGNCTCVDFENDPLGALMVTQAHVHEKRADETESYFYARDHCDGHVLHVLIFPPSPPPPSPSDFAPPPAPPYILWQEKMVGGAFATTGLWFFTFCTFCAWCGLGGRVRGGGRSKWFGFGTDELRINRPPKIGVENDRGYFPTQSPSASVGFFGSLPIETSRATEVTEGLLHKSY